ncbi:MAG: formylglycine-generating enzyme family protein [Microcoleus sp. PH2017_10_PVI_O_A]|uniref:formylglycine-generating enzyme family protein n=1 Tax=unclassified Microcoleus TaxID=2642155 RepID=UPI001DD9B8AB|nr:MULTISPECIES: formylglycine-generating enzyme family protein [unclassified Microcoleus]TAE85435.1 MAG: formylglycine-generating enzyme family protein [Oscillatoriales cyanobacterium]MCC3404707.1 formylglycine-generating enzyme family protein [Microcoleus sp. PH2017_10_PVI_O_A]MCC3458727.1 formylglycine-generating enzyme family protein [Microcoleus sp. PH2017_11_PCY_U_A]MCC3477518.1 formylglycine-generating enzyme family protein [Microcoleus sp. PH2017_12_PCY_D_A]MCC3527176.1 formylglycine-g
MPNEQDRPGEYDAVLGGQNSIPVNAAVLGGIAGVKSRLASPIVEVRIAALSEALKYGEVGLKLIIQALHDESMQVKISACSLLKDRSEEKIQQHLQNYFPIFEFDVITVDAYGKENSRRKSWVHYFREDLGNGVVLDMVYIPGGTFMMGSPETEYGRQEHERPQHQVTVPTFYAGKYPITQEQWQAVMGNNPSEFKGAQLPVEKVTWNDAVNFCQKLSEKTGKNYRLPSEAEWEYACRADTTTAFHFGETITPDLVNYKGSYPCGSVPGGLFRHHTTVVGSFPPNAFGLYDMHGNVWEWCELYRHDGYNGTPSDSGACESGSDYRLQCGGSWLDHPLNCRAAYRRCDSAGNSSGLRGFRVVALQQLPISPSSLR